MEFEELTSLQKEYALEIMTRARATAGTVRKLLKEITMAVVEQPPFMMVCLKSGKKESFGFAKQCTYAPSADEWDSERGMRIAMSNAVRNMCGKK